MANPLGPVPNGSKLLDAMSNISKDWAQWFRAVRDSVLRTAAQSVTQSSLPKLTQAEAGYLYFVSDFNHTLQWNGSGWGWAPGEEGNGFAVLYPLAAPTTIGWHLCDGTTQNQLNADGTVSAVLLPTIANTYFRL